MISHVQTWWRQVLFWIDFVLYRAVRIFALLFLFKLLDLRGYASILMILVGARLCVTAINAMFYVRPFSVKDAETNVYNFYSKFIFWVDLMLAGILFNYLSNYASAAAIAFALLSAAALLFAVFRRQSLRNLLIF